ncbi:2'-5' RNA ligase family protein [Cryobacterium breve]
MPRLVVVLPLAPLTVGDTFLVRDWPLHVTVLAPFLTDAAPDVIAAALTAAASALPALSVVAGGGERFGRRHDIPVTVLESNPEPDSAARPRGRGRAPVRGCAQRGGVHRDRVPGACHRQAPRAGGCRRHPRTPPARARRHGAPGRPGRPRRARDDPPPPAPTRRLAGSETVTVGAALAAECGRALAARDGMVASGAFTGADGG